MTGAFTYTTAGQGTEYRDRSAQIGGKSTASSSRLFCIHSYPRFSLVPQYESAHTGEFVYLSRKAEGGLSERSERSVA